MTVSYIALEEIPDLPQQDKSTLRQRDSGTQEVKVMIDDIAGQTISVPQTGIGIGAAIAIVCSWQRNRSILWAILAGILSWFYVVYFAMTRRPDERK